MENTETKTTIRERLKEGYSAACKELKRTEKRLEDFKAIHEEDAEAQAFFSLHKITTVIKALKEGKKTDYNNPTEEKHYPWWWMKDSAGCPGSGFSLVDVICGDADSSVGARLSSFTEDDARFVADLMPEDYKNWMKE